MVDWHDWNTTGKPEYHRLVVCEVKSGYEHICFYTGGHNYHINGVVEGTLFENKVIRWKYK